MKLNKYETLLASWHLHLSQKVILAHHVPVPDLHRNGSLLTQLLWIQLQL